MEESGRGWRCLKSSQCYNVEMRPRTAHPNNFFAVFAVRPPGKSNALSNARGHPPHVTHRLQRES